MEVITSHIHADFDAYASMVAAKLLYPAAHLVFPGSQEKSVRDFLEENPHLQDDILKLRQVDLDAITRLVVVDTRQLSRIGPFADIIGRNALDVIVFDHHPEAVDNIAAGACFCRELGSNVALMVERLKQSGVTVSSEAATIMAIGLYEDTGGLLFASTTPEDCRALADLIAWGADMVRVSRSVSKELSPDQIRALDQLIRNARVILVNGLSVLMTQASVAAYVEDFAMLVHKLEGMHTADAVFALGRMGERIYLVARSILPQLDAARVAAHFGGGGHQTAAASSIKNMSLEQAERELLIIIEKEARPLVTAADIMTSPVKGLRESESIDAAGQLLNRYNINAAVVFRGSGGVGGIITRQIVSRAQGHNLGQAKIRDYMIRDFQTVEAAAPVWDIRRIIVDGGQRLLPVMGAAGLAGVITRKDLLLVMHEKMRMIENLDHQQAKASKSLKQVLKERLPDDFYETLKDAGRLAQSAGYKVYLVGGIVRDLLLHNDNLDVDLVVEGDGADFARRLARYLGARVATHEKYKTAVITLKGGRHIDVATARLEYYEVPGGFPQVEESTLKLDLYRRDFTINTLAVALNPERFGLVVDYFGAQRDLKDKRISVLHSLSFVEDPSRILRAVRFEQRLGFALGKQTQSLVRAAIKSGFLGNVSGRRLSHELKQLLCEADPSKAMSRLQQLGVLGAIHPELGFNESIKTCFVQIKETLSWFRLLYTHEEVKGWLVYLLALIDHLGSEMIQQIAGNLGLTALELNRLLEVRDNATTMLRRFAQTNKLLPSEAVSILDGAGLEEILFVMSRVKDAAIKELISAHITQWRHYRPPVSGYDLMQIGFRQGPEMGDCLNLIREKGLNGEITSFNDALAFARQYKRGFQ